MSSTISQELIGTIHLDKIYFILFVPSVAVFLFVQCTSYWSITREAISSFSGSFPFREQTEVSCIGRLILYHWGIGEALEKQRDHQVQLWSNCANLNCSSEKKKKLLNELPICKKAIHMKIWHKDFLKNYHHKNIH